MDSEILLSKDIINQRKKVSKYIVDETILKVGSEYVWLWVATEPKNRQIFVQNITKERNMFVAERFIQGLVKIIESIPF